MFSYKRNFFEYTRRPVREVRVGSVGLGGPHPIVVQSMLTSDTMDTDSCLKEAMELVDCGCQIVRITAPTVKDASNLEFIRKGLDQLGCNVPIVADIHFKPEAAMEAAKWVEKIRINPGNFSDRKKFIIRSYTDQEYNEELRRIEQTFLPLLEFCSKRKIALRIGTNHGSLSDRIMNRYGDTPHGMVESALEYATVCRKYGFHDIVFSMKASNPRIMIAAYRLLVERLEKLGEDWNYPIHVGVTEAGDGEDGRIKSAIGIGSLLADGIGDTIRVSLTESSVHEIPVAKKLIAVVEELAAAPAPKVNGFSFKPSFEYNRRPTLQLDYGIAVGGEAPVRVAVPLSHYDYLRNNPPGKEFLAEFPYDPSAVSEVDLDDIQSILALKESPTKLVTIKDGSPYPPIFAFRALASILGDRHPILLKDTFYPERDQQAADKEKNLIASSLHIGSLLCDGIGDAILIRRDPDPSYALVLAYSILQGAGNRIVKTEYVACPSCGRTLFDLQSTTARIKKATGHLKGLKIAVMGCIVNGPGEMADADFGYVGGAPGKVNLYVGKKAVRFNIPEAEAVEALIELIKKEGKWIDAAS
ncbi:4-hydroxy-3-methylbut-2-en-1-yl diphosphate synthase [Candidatus Methylacidiphilum fumarolicum]|uniref:4-hydroxy-3-methylbut-2-en-1-yl diphosphate synthase (flavodoxin) n=2 Tax=Candidatus Methylacidiphilum fumarolicum TaxID=591154 RepID=I0JZ68_METFB|nr:(E)-4-hydroxy-3-methylbut-2-enyl-diphosphate synthase [Candidatus Methylacidiphilum fumarolicum]MBW6414692.1 (E)-4-hydroxy-3-methylbut-2-enyl-diphosphate synthase [Candidatus Methylacidiphilum fumarolicum]TFE70167.1 4-hydroxy-3-methylbut-2-en-1-yl diphosphate synthase [Candidatus Methylacidiphilum fumarolicum]TFE74265.1 4-hydroxy-3-methylbut-2-en-1-yl diphosphate synthase [Candidatus Methylacidiphilum fumarolicum]TFE75764.1 4-hydroxy-3-methylbut-2-en-1-yl diphosphate synthase [Candidatus Met